MMSKRVSSLLIDEPSPQVVPSLAVAVGINAAIFAQQVHFWCEASRKRGDQRNYKDGRWWTHNTIKQWQQQMPWLSEKGIRNLVKYLRSEGLILTAKHGDDSYDHTLWYAVDYEKITAIENASDDHKGQNDVEVSADSDSEVSADSDSEVSADSIYEPESPPESLPENSPRVAEATPDKSDEPPAKQMNTMTIDRCREVGFEPSGYQCGNWGKGWARYVYAEEGQEPPSLEEQYAVLSEIVAAAAGRLGKGRFFLAVDDAVSRVRDKQPRNQHNGHKPTPPEPRKPVSKPRPVTDEEAGLV